MSDRPTVVFIKLCEACGSGILPGAKECPCTWPTRAPVTTEPIETPKAAYRPATEGDLPFIRNSWLQTYLHSPLCFGVHRDVYYPAYRAIINDILSRSAVTMACDPDDPDHL